jgi:hypothetical protein
MKELRRWRCRFSRVVLLFLVTVRPPFFCGSWPVPRFFQFFLSLCFTRFLVFPPWVCDSFSVQFPWFFRVLRLLSFSSSFWNDEGTKKMMKTLAGFILTDFWVFPLSAGTKTISRIILVSVCAALLFSPSLCVLFFCCSGFMLCFFLCYLLSFICSLRPVSPQGSALFFSPFREVAFAQLL